MAQIDDYWAGFFGLSLDDFLRPGLKVVPHAHLQGYPGAWLFRYASSLIFSLPPFIVEEFEAKIPGQSEGITDQYFVRLFGERVEKVIGPAYQGYLEETNFRPVVSSARLLSRADDSALLELQADCDEEEWEHSGIHVEQVPNFGIFTDSCLVAASNYQVDDQGVASPGLITHSDCRGRGHGKAVLSAATEHGLGQGFLMLYQTLVANKPAVSVAESLGYTHYATHLAVRLRV